MNENDIAVIGMAGRFPGASTIAEFWENIRGGVESIQRLTDEELLAAGVAPEDLRDPAYVKACPVVAGIDTFDARFFGFSPRDASVMDPAHRIFLEVAWEAFEHAGHTALPEEDVVGVFAGSGAPYYLMDNVRRNRELMRSMGEFLVRHTNNDMNFLATRVSYEMDLRGPSVNVQTACSSALVSVHMACESIRRGECTMALAGGSTVLIPDRHGYRYQEGEIMSPDGHCRPFDAESAGTVFGSGSGCVVLKRLSSALDAGDTVHAVIKGSAINNDGAQRVGYLAPGVEGQAAVVSRALEVAGVSPDSISYIEAHGTGTSVGDPIEVTALNQAFRGKTERRHFCAIGSVKSNIGHLGEAAGIAALIKAICALKHREIPASLGYAKPNPQIDFEDSPFFVNDRLRPWQSKSPRRCGVTALGAGGTNCHVILEEAPTPIDGEGARSAQLVVLSAKSSQALEQACENLADALEANPALDFADVAYTSAVGRRALDHRCALVASTREDAIEALRSRDPKRVIGLVAEANPGGVVFMFPGGGAQYARMGVELFEEEPVYRETVRECLAIVNKRLGQDFGAKLFGPASSVAEASRQLERPSLSLPALFTTEYALARLFMSWGIEPVAYVGHSMGEYVAACLAGVMTVEEALELVMLRGRLFEAVPRGRMLSMPLSEENLRAVMMPGLSIAAVNAPELCVASGPSALIEELEQTLASRDIESTRVHIDVAAHSGMLDEVLDEFRRFCRTVAWQAPRTPFLSNVSGTWISPAEATDPEYWVRHLRSTVRFADCLSTIQAAGAHVLLEIGPGRTLSTLARAQRNPVRHALNSMRHPDESASALSFALMTLGRLWLAGVPIEWSAVYEGQLRNRVPLPTYAWDHQRHWIDAPGRIEDALPSATDPKGHARRATPRDWFERPAWRQTAPPAPLVDKKERVLLFADDTGFSDEIVSRLQDAGRDVFVVRVGSSFAQSGNAFTIRPDVLADYERMLKALASGGIPGRVVHAWGVTSHGDASTMNASITVGFHSLLCFAQALTSEDPDASLVMNLLTNNLQRVGGETLLEPIKALGLGPLRVMPREHPNVRSRSIDITLPAEAHRRSMLAALVAAEITSDGADETIAFRGTDRFAQSQEVLSMAAVASRLKDRGVYLITGGLGGIGYTLAKHLAETRHARLILMSRGASPAAAGSRVAALEKLGAEVELVRADVTDEGQVRQAVDVARRRFGRLDGVFHAAGTLGDSLMALKTREDAERVLAPKVRGTLALDAALGDTPLDLFVLFSSISSVAGLAGQADYTAANAFLDAFAHERNARRGAFTVAINWSGWREVGMAANIAEGSGAGSGVGEEVHPLVGRRIWSGAESELFAADVAGASHWTVGEHRLRGGSILMPGTGYLEIARAIVEARPEARVVEIRDMVFMSALLVPDDSPREVRVHRARNGSLAIAARATAEDGSVAWQECVTAEAEYVDVNAPVPLDIAAIQSRCSVSEETFTPTQESVNMDFGARWKNLRSIRYGRGEALVTLELPRPFAADLETYRLHPALLDMATGRCERLVAGFDPARDFYVPLSYTRLRMFAPLSARIYSHVRLANSDFDTQDVIAFDVTITDESGRVLVDIAGFVMTKVASREQLESSRSRATASRSGGRFEPPPAPTSLPPLVQWLEDGIRPAEGMEALEHIVNGPNVPQVFATPRPTAALIAQMRAQVVTSPAPEKPPARILTRFPDTEAKLQNHPAVAKATVVERFDRPGNRHVVAYIEFRNGESPTVSELRRFVRKEVPQNAVPGTILVVEQMPLGAAGEVDVSQLHDPFGVADDYIAPRTDTERLIASIWKETLGIDKVGVRDNFFDIGGHSLLAVRTVVKLHKAVGVRLNQAIMVLQTLEQIAAEIDRQRGAASADPAPVSTKSGPLTPAPGNREESGGVLSSLRNAVSRRRK